MIEAKHQPGFFLNFTPIRNETVTGASNQQRHTRVNAENLENLRSLSEELRSHEDQPKGGFGGVELRAQFFSPLLQSALVKIAGPMSGHGKVTLHEQEVNGKTVNGNCGMGGGRVKSKR